MTSLPPWALRSKDVRPSLVALPTFWDRSLPVPAAGPRVEVLLAEDEPFICLATLELELLADDDPLTDEPVRR